jgi:hypothetical protein
MKKFVINEDVVAGLIAYLSQRPYSEVSVGIQTLSNLMELQENTIDKNVENV